MRLVKEVSTSFQLRLNPFDSHASPSARPFIALMPRLYRCMLSPVRPVDRVCIVAAASSEPPDQTMSTGFPAPAANPSMSVESTVVPGGSAPGYMEDKRMSIGLKSYRCD